MGNVQARKWSKVAHSAADLQKASDAGRNLETKEICGQLKIQTTALKDIKKALRVAKVEIDAQNEMEDMNKYTAVEIIQIHSKIVNEIKMKIEMIKINYDMKIDAKDSEIKRLKSQPLNIIKEAKPIVEMIKNPTNSTLNVGTSQVKPNQIKSRAPKMGDHVVSMWGQSKWQYFTATVVGYDKNTRIYTIDWDDKDPTGREISYEHIACDVKPDENLIGIGTVVLFHQATYRAANVHNITRSGGYRWHQGIITGRTRASNGQTLFSGHHTKGEADGKWITYKDYSPEFTNYTVEDFRLSPNIYDLLDAEHIHGADEYDVYVSYNKIDCPSYLLSASDQRDVSLPPSYQQAVLQDIVDPRDIVNSLKELNCKVAYDEERLSPEVIAENINRSKVFIACLTDEYVKNKSCVDEFIYAKKTGAKVVIPIVVGSGSFQWMMSVVGLLIAGELYIHFKNKSVEKQMLSQLAYTIKPFYDSIHLPDDTIKQQMKKGNCEIFLSYAWKNSQESVKSGEVSSSAGSKFADPRLIKRELEKKLGKPIWLDIERLAGGGDNTAMGMFEQIASALSHAKVLVCCVSKEYAESENCKMEFQFAAKSLKKPLVALIVGNKEDDWRTTSVGMIVSQLDGMINFQFEGGKIGGSNVSMLFNLKLNQTKDKILSIIDAKQSRGETKKRPFSHQIKDRSETKSVTSTKSLVSRAKKHVPKKVISRKKKATQISGEGGIAAMGLFRPSTLPSSPIHITIEPYDAHPFELLVAPNLDDFKLFCGHTQISQFMEMIEEHSESKVKNKKVSMITDINGIVETKDLCSNILSTTLREIGLQPNSTIRIETSEEDRIVCESAGVTDEFELEDSDSTPVHYPGDEEDYYSGFSAEELAFRAPTTGDAVICNYQREHGYYPAVIKSILADRMEYEIAWDDGDETNVIHRYDEVAMNVKPATWQVGKGTTILFRQGEYQIKATNKMGARWHKGIITEVYNYQTDDGEMEARYAGHHTNLNEGYRFRGFRHYFHDLTLDDIRIPPNPMDALLAFNKLVLNETL